MYSEQIRLARLAGNEALIKFSNSTIAVRFYDYDVVVTFIEGYPETKEFIKLLRFIQYVSRDVSDRFVRRMTRRYDFGLEVSSLDGINQVDTISYEYFDDDRGDGIRSRSPFLTIHVPNRVKVGRMYETSMFD